MTTHFWLGGSIAKRALNCPGSLQYKSSGSSAAADRGTLLHEAMTRLTTGHWPKAEHAVGFSWMNQIPTHRPTIQEDMLIDGSTVYNVLYRTTDGLLNIGAINKAHAERVVAALNASSHVYIDVAQSEK